MSDFILQKALEFFGSPDSAKFACYQSFLKFLRASREQQEEAFLKVRSYYKNDTPEVLEKYTCWRDVDQMIKHIHSNCVNSTLSNGGSWLMMDLGRNIEEMSHV